MTRDLKGQSPRTVRLTPGPGAEGTTTSCSRGRGVTEHPGYKAKSRMNARWVVADRDRVRRLDVKYSHPGRRIQTPSTRGVLFHANGINYRFYGSEPVTGQGRAEQVLSLSKLSLALLVDQHEVNRTTMALDRFCVPTWYLSNRCLAHDGLLTEINL